MTRKVDRAEIIDFETYEENRDVERRRIMRVKEPRRVHVGDHLTFLFENADTMRYQIQEMIRVERIVKEAAIRHEIDTYNGLLGGPGQLGCSLLIEIDDPAERKHKLTEWRGLPEALYLRLEDGTRVHAVYDAEQVGEDRLSAVQYLKFDTGGRVPVAVGSEFPGLTGETELSEAQRRALAADLTE